MLKEGGKNTAITPQVGPDIDELFGEDSDRQVKMDQIDENKKSILGSSIKRKNNLSELVEKKEYFGASDFIKESQDEFQKN